AAVAVTACDAAAARAAVVIDGAVVEVERAGDAEDPAATHAGRRNGVPTHVAAVQDERRPGAGAHRAACDPAACTRRPVACDAALVETQDPSEVEDAAAESGRALTGGDTARDGDSVERHAAAGRT